LGILVEVFWFVLTTSPFSSLAICAIFNIPPKIPIEKHNILYAISIAILKKQSTKRITCVVEKVKQAEGKYQKTKYW